MSSTKIPEIIAASIAGFAVRLLPGGVAHGIDHHSDGFFTRPRRTMWVTRRSGCYLRLLIPGLHVDLTDYLPVFDVGDDVLEDAVPVREDAVDAERDPVRSDHLVGYANAEVRPTDPREELGDLLLADHAVGSAWRREMPVFCPFGVVRVEGHPTIEILALEGLLERCEIEPCLPLFGYDALL